MTQTQQDLDSTSPLLLLDYLPSDPHQRDTVAFYLLSYPTLVPTLTQAIAIAAEVFPPAGATIGLAYGETQDPPLQLHLASSSPDIMDHDLYRLYMNRLETLANADLRWFVVTTSIVSRRRIMEEETAAHYRTGSS